MVRKISFSERLGIAPLLITQDNDIDHDLRVALWNNFYRTNEILELRFNTTSLIQTKLSEMYQDLWIILNRPLDTVPLYTYQAALVIKQFILEEDWWRIYDFIEAIPKILPSEISSNFIREVNDSLEQFRSSYRFLECKLVKITEEEERGSIGDALESLTQYEGARIHLATAVQYLSDRKNPDYRNSIKESISAVESICQEVTKEESATLGACLSILQQKEDKKLHPALMKAMKNLYGYTANADGIRHAMLEESSVDYIDAKYLLVICSAFINYITGKLAMTNS